MRTVCSTCLTEMHNEAQAQRHPRESGHALIPLSAQQVEAWERGGCIVTIFTARGIGKQACGEPAVDGRLCAGHAAEKARLS